MVTSWEIDRETVETVSDFIFLGSKIIVDGDCSHEIKRCLLPGRKAKHGIIDAFELWCWRKLLRVPWTARRSSKSILQEISPEYSLEKLMLKLKLQYLGTWCEELTHWNRPCCWKDWRREEKGTTEDEMVGWHHWLDGHEFEQAPRVGDGQGGLACCSPWGCKESDTTERLNWTELMPLLKTLPNAGWYYLSPGLG